MHLGELEKLTLHNFWDCGPADAKQVFSYFEERRGGTLNTIQSTQDRLFKKDQLQREKHGHAYLYQTAIHRATFIGNLINDISNDFGAWGGKYTASCALNFTQ